MYTNTTEFNTEIHVYNEQLEPYTQGCPRHNHKL